MLHRIADATRLLPDRFGRRLRAVLWVAATLPLCLACDDEADTGGVVDAQGADAIVLDGAASPDRGPDASDLGPDLGGDGDLPRPDLAVLPDGGDAEIEVDLGGAEAGTDADVGPDPDGEVDDGGEPGDLGPLDDLGPDAGPIDRCAPYAELRDQVLIDALHAELHRTYRPIAVEDDLGGNPNRYTTARALMFKALDFEVRPDGSAGRECVYTGRFEVGVQDVEPPDEVLNCEHTWPRSRMSPRESLRYSHQESDLHHLLTTVPGVNSMRGNFPFGEPVSDRNLSYSPAVLGRDAGGRQVFQPRAERRGDVARVIFYFAARWGIDLPDFEETVLKAWMLADPVDDRERVRNDRVEAIQGNRNPFVDCPQLVGQVRDFAAFPSLDTDQNLPAP